MSGFYTNATPRQLERLRLAISEAERTLRGLDAKTPKPEMLQAARKAHALMRDASHLSNLLEPRRRTLKEMGLD